jgi:hypothetical protein
MKSIGKDRLEREREREVPRLALQQSKFDKGRREGWMDGCYYARMGAILKRILGFTVRVERLRANQANVGIEAS